MAWYIARRTGAAVIVLFVLSLLAFGMVRMIPGDPALIALGVEDPTQAERDAMAEQLGLNVPWPQQYLSWVGNALTGDLGQSLTRPWPVGEQLVDRLPVSIELAVIALILAIAWGVTTGIMAAVRPGSIVDVVVRSTAFLGLAIPIFVVGAVVIILNAQTLRMQLIGYVPFTEDPIANISLLLVPALVLALPLGATLARYTRGALLDTLSQDFIRTARSKGVPARRILVRHALRNALIPVTTIAGIQLASLIGGTVLIETVFALPGTGTMLIEAINSNDFPTVQACLVVLGFVYVAINLAVDLLYPVIDPRVRTVSR